MQDPFQCPFKTLSFGEYLIATWIDRELLIARMGSLPLNEPFKRVLNEVIYERSNLEQAILPAGDVGTCSRCRTTCHDQYGWWIRFVLWNRGIYGFDVNGVERWRAHHQRGLNCQNFQWVKKLLTCSNRNNNRSVVKRWVSTIIQSKWKSDWNGHFDLEGSLSSVYGTSSSRLLLLNDGRCYLYQGREKVADLSTQDQFSMPISRQFNMDSLRLERILLKESL